MLDINHQRPYEFSQFPPLRKSAVIMNENKNTKELLKVQPSVLQQSELFCVIVVGEIGRGPNRTKNPKKLRGQRLGAAACTYTHASDNDPLGDRGRIKPRNLHVIKPAPGVANRHRVSVDAKCRSSNRLPGSKITLFFGISNFHDTGIARRRHR